MNYPIFQLFILLTVFFSCAQVKTPKVTFKPTTYRELSSHSDLNSLSKTIEKLQKQFKAMGYKSFYIGGGSSRTILDNIYFDKPIEMRDLDIFLIHGREITREEAQSLARELEQSGLGQFAEKDLRPRPRGNPSLSGSAAFNYNAGFGFHLMGENDHIDISIFHSEFDLRLNGVLSFDTTMIKMGTKKSLIEVGEELKKLNPQMLETSIFIDDRHAGYQDWLQRKVKVVHEIEFGREPYLQTIRLVRSLAKIEADEVETELTQFLEGQLSKAPPRENFQILRNLEKLMLDKSFLAELKLLHQFSFFKETFPSLEKFLNEASWESFESQFLKRLSSIRPNAPNDPFNRLLTLLSFVSLDERKSCLKHLFGIDHNKTFKNIDMILGKPFEEIKIGYFTGEFAPFHLGHLNVAQRAIEEGKLDYVFIIPTPHPTNTPKTRKFKISEWSERIQFSTIGTKDEKLIGVFPNLLNFAKGKSKLKLSNILPEITDQMPGKIPPWTHVMGMDSFYRLVERKLLKTDPRPRIVVERAGSPPIANDFKHVQFIESKLESSISATRILQALASEESTSDLSPEVLKEVKSTSRYQEIISGYKESTADMSEALQNIDFHQKRPFYIIDMLQNPDGLLLDQVFDPKRLSILIESINHIKDPDDKILLFLDSEYFGQDTILDYSTFLNNNNYLDVSIIRELDAIPANEQVLLLHSGIVQNDLSFSNNLIDDLEAGKLVLIYETDDSPLGPNFNQFPSEMILRDSNFCPGKLRQKIKVH